MEDKANSLLINENTMSFEDVVNLVEQFQESLAGLQYQISNKNFGSKIYQAKDVIASKGRFVAGNKNDVAILDGKHATWRLWVGHETPTSAPFRVDKDGNVTATSLTISGYIATGGAAADVNAGATTISGGKITAGSIEADRMNVSSLSAISANIGTITAGSITGVTITGGTVQTSSSGLRTVLDSSDDNIKFMSGSTVYSQIYPYVFPQGNGIYLETGGVEGSGDAFVYIQEGTSSAAGIGTSSASLDFWNNDATLSASLITLSGDVDVTGALATTGTNDHITIEGNAFLRLRQMSGTTADGLSGIQNGCMYYRTDDGVIRVRVGGAWKSVTVA